MVGFSALGWVFIALFVMVACGENGNDVGSINPGDLVVSGAGQSGSGGTPQTGSGGSGGSAGTTGSAGSAGSPPVVCDAQTCAPGQVCVIHYGKMSVESSECAPDPCAPGALDCGCAESAVCDAATREFCQIREDIVHCPKPIKAL